MPHSMRLCIKTFFVFACLLFFMNHIHFFVSKIFSSIASPISPYKYEWVKLYERDGSLHFFIRSIFAAFSRRRCFHYSAIHER